MHACIVIEERAERMEPPGERERERESGSTGSISMLYNPAMPPTNGVLNNLSTRVEKGAAGAARVPKRHHRQSFG